MPATVTRLSTRGQVVIPASVRRRIGLVPGDDLTVDLGSDRSIILRRRSPVELRDQLEAGYRWLKATGVDPVEALHEARRRARHRERQRRRP